LVRNMNTQIARYKEEQQSLYAKQEQLRRNMSSLGSSGKEGTLRQRVVDQLETSQDRLEAIDSEIADLNTKIVETEATIDTMIAALGEKYPSE